MRRFYKLEFNRVTGFIFLKRCREGNYYARCLDKFLDEEVLPKYFVLSQVHQKERQSIFLVLGSLIYPKEEIDKSICTPLEKIRLRLIYDMNYKFNMATVLEVGDSVKAFKILYNVFVLARKEQLLSENHTMIRSLSEYQKGFDALDEIF